MLSSIVNLIVVTVTATIIAQPQRRSANGANCQVVGKLAELRGLPEASGVAASRRTPELFWAHNDSGDPLIFALDSRGIVKNRVAVTGAGVDDWEDIAVGPCPQGSCVYIADIGDNNVRRKNIVVYRVAEPAPDDTATSRAEAFQAEYPDGPHDAEALFVTAESDVFLITKGDPGPVALYRFPRPLASGPTMRLQRVGDPLAGGNVPATDRPTAADISPDGRWVAVRTTHWVAFYRTADLVAGRWVEVFRNDLSVLDEPRGEGVTFAGNDRLVLVGEAGGPLKGPGTFARLACTFSEK